MARGLCDEASSGGSTRWLVPFVDKIGMCWRVCVFDEVTEPVTKKKPKLEFACLIKVIERIHV